MSLPKINASLTSTGRSNGTPYTDSEKATARMTILGLLIGAGVVEPDHSEADDISEEVIAAISETVDENEGHDLGLPNLARRAYKKVQEAHFDGDTAVDPDNWPKKRDYTSIGLMFRKQVRDLKVLNDEQVNAMFPSYSSKKKAG